MRCAWCFAVVLLVAGVAGGQEVKPEDLKKLYNDTLVQLKAAQDRRAELAAENQKLTARIAELEKQLQPTATQNDQLRRQAADAAERSFFLRTYYAAWTQFNSTHPDVKLQWDLFLNRSTLLGSGQQTPIFDPQWPLSDRAD